MRRRWLIAALLLLTAWSLYAVTTRLSLDPDVAGLLPERGESAALRSYLRAFGGSDLAMLLVEGDDPTEVSAATDALVEALRRQSTVQQVASGVGREASLDPMLVWRHADARTRAALAAALSDVGMRQRLRASRELLLTPGGGASERIARDPLRLTQLLADARAIGSGFHAQADGSFSNDDGGARLVLVMPRGQALRGADARAFVAQARAAMAEVTEAHTVRIGLTGGHAIGEATEAMLERDLKLSTALSLLLATLAFGLAFRRLRALVAVMPPLALGTLWTASIAAAMPGGLSAIAVAFMSVVIGVGVDTGVHVYASLLEARRAGMSPSDAAIEARRRSARPVLVAAATAAAAFAALSLSEIAALRQLGVLCAGGEMLTALAIVVVTPEIGAWLERGPPPPEREPWWTRRVAGLTSDRARAVGWLAVLCLPVLALGMGYAPKIADAIVAMRPDGLAPLQVQQRIYGAFGGRSGQWVIMVRGEHARERSDAIAEAIASVADGVESLDTLSAIAPAPATQRGRLAERDALDMPAKADALHAALEATGFSTEPFEATLADMRAPSHDIVALDALRDDERALMLSRYVGHDQEPVIVSYVLPVPGHEARVEAAIRGADPDAAITGYGRLEQTLRDSLRADMPRIGGVAALLVLLALGLSLRRLRDVVLAALVVIAEIALVLWLVAVFDVPLHAYDALVLPVLLGITVDEAMFLLYRARDVDDAVRETLRQEGPPIATTALTTAAGFAGLLICDFDGLRHLGAVGALGSLAGLVVALLIVPAGMRLVRARS